MMTPYARRKMLVRRKTLMLLVLRIARLPIAVVRLIVDRAMRIVIPRRVREVFMKEWQTASIMSYILWDHASAWYDWWDSIQQWWMAKLPGRYLTPYQHHNPIARSIRYRWAGGNWTLNQVLRAELRRRKMTHRQMVQQPGLPGTFINSYGLQQYDD